MEQRNQFYGTIGIRGTEQQLAEQEIANRAQVAQIVSGERGFQEFATGLQQGTYDLHPVYKQDYEQLVRRGSDIARSMNSGEITREQGMAALRENGQELEQFLRSTPQWARNKQAPSPQETFQGSIVTDEKTKKRYIATPQKGGGVTYKPLDDNKEEKDVPNFKTQEEYQSWYQARKVFDTLPSGKKITRFIPPNGNPVDISDDDGQERSNITQAETVKQIAVAADMLMKPRKTRDDSGEVIEIPGMAPDEAFETARKSVVESMKLYGEINIGNQKLPYANEDIRASVEDDRKSIRQAQMLRQLIMYAPPEVLNQLGINKARAISNVGRETQGAARPQASLQSVESEIRSIAGQYPKGSVIPDDVKARLQELGAQRQRMMSNAGR